MATAQTKTKAFLQHGINIVRTTADHAICDCLFCGAEGKFYLNLETQGWDCKVCGKDGGLNLFFEEKGILNVKRLRGVPAMELAKDRGVRVKTLRAWGVGWDGAFYTIPARLNGKTSDLRTYRIGKRLRSSPGGKAGLSGLLSDQDTVWVCEGEWDGLALWQQLQELGVDHGVVSVSGASSFPRKATEAFVQREVRLVYDNDEPGAKGMEKVRTMLSGTSRKVKWVKWPHGLEIGYDVRDLIRDKGDEALALLESYLIDKEETAEAGAASADTLDGEGLEADEVVKRYREWLYLSNTEVLSVIFGTLFANRLDGDPLWLFLVAPPGGTKTELLMSLSIAPRITFNSLCNARTYCARAKSGELTIPTRSIAEMPNSSPDCRSCSRISSRC